MDTILSRHGPWRIHGDVLKIVSVGTVWFAVVFRSRMASSSVSEVSETAVYSPFEPDSGGGEAGTATVATGNAGMRGIR